MDWCEFRRVLRTEPSLDLKVVLVVVMVYIGGLTVRAIEAIFGGV